LRASGFDGRYCTLVERSFEVLAAQARRHSNRLARRLTSLREAPHSTPAAPSAD